MPVLVDKDGPYDFQDPADVRPITLDWTAWLADLGLTAADITSISWTSPDGMTKVAESDSAGLASVLTSGGTLGQDYRWKCRCVAGAHAQSVGFRLKIREG